MAFVHHLSNLNIRWPARYINLAAMLLNVDFWVNETRHCLAVIDSYQNARAAPCRAAEYEMKHEVVSKTPPIQRAAKHNARQESRRLVAKRLKILVRCHREGLPI